MHRPADRWLRLWTGGSGPTHPQWLPSLAWFLEVAQQGHTEANGRGQALAPRVRPTLKVGGGGVSGGVWRVMDEALDRGYREPGL